MLLGGVVLALAGISSWRPLEDRWASVCLTVLLVGASACLILWLDWHLIRTSLSLGHNSAALTKPAIGYLVSCLGGAFATIGAIVGLAVLKAGRTRGSHAVALHGQGPSVLP